MSECMAATKKENLVPSEDIYKLYRVWARGGWGLIITGKETVDFLHP
jgi:2,4-dienoyl-CoA reductase-like NADH-dependent reductase (Old Yellow Enzyme family)